MPPVTSVNKERQWAIKPTAIAATADGAPWGEHRRKLNWILALESQGAYQRSTLIKPKLLYFSIHRKSLNSLT